MDAKHTPGPWFADACGKIWRRNPQDLYEYGGTVAGDKPLAVAYLGWIEEGEQGFPLEANARLIAAAPELLAAAKNFDAYEKAVEAGDDIDAMCIYAATSRMMRAAIAKATGEQQ